MGQWYTDTVGEKMILGLDGRFLIPIVIACDRTPNTGNTRFSTEPMLFTLLIIKQELWHLPHVWRPLAMIPSNHKQSQAELAIARGRQPTKFSSSRNYHRILSAALESLANIQTRTIPLPGLDEPGKEYDPEEDRGMLTMLTMGSRQRPMNCIITVSHLMVDGQEAEKMSCLLKSSAVENDRICWGCTCTYHNSDQPFTECFDIDVRCVTETFYKASSQPNSAEILSSVFPRVFCLAPLRMPCGVSILVTERVVCTSVCWLSKCMQSKEEQ